MQSISKSVEILLRRLSCQHSYRLSGIDSGVLREPLAYFFRCDLCGHELYIPLAEDSEHLDALAIGKNKI